MKQNENILNKSISKLKLSKNKVIFNITIFKESEVVVRTILEKITSTVISKMFEKKVENKIANFCLLELKNKLDNIIDMQFIKHDKDDLSKKKIFKNKSQKIMVNKNRNNEHFLLLTEEKAINKNLNQSQIIPDYELS